MALAALPGRASGDIIDQFNLVYPPTPLGGAAVYSQQTVAQTFQVGLSGTLSRIAVDVYNPTQFPASQPLIFELRTTLADGSPNPSSVLLSRSVPASSVPVGERGPEGYVVFDLSASRVEVTAGHLLAFSLYSNDSLNSYGAGLSSDNAYPQGQEFFRMGPGGSGGPFTPDIRGGIDLGFVEYVDVVPEPSSLVLGTGAVALLGYYGARRRARPRA
jgi:hypothetical protein